MKAWRNTLTSPSTPLKEAIKKMDKSAQQILIIVNKKEELLGTVTDGDIRRSLINEINLEIPISEIMNKNPHSAKPEWGKNKIIKFMEEHSISQVPIVDQNGIVIGIKNLRNLLNTTSKENPVFIMAGGFGKRLHPLTKDCPKPLLKIGKKPILEIILESFIEAGFYNFFISTHYMPEKIQDYFGDGSNWGVTINYIHEEQPLGTAGALGLLPKDKINSPLFMINGDILTNLDYHSLLKEHIENNSDITVCVRQHEYQIPYGIIESEDTKIISIKEKPTYKFDVNAGIYLISPNIIKNAPSNKKMDMPELIKENIKSKKKINLFKLNDYWLDIGRMDDFKQAQSDIIEFFS
ncbi:alcohol dehydrogenase [Terasakiispira papahanaumokuakeensis]|uniref:Alcohol dehydrogenase n=1 Tax=Terasakiispira papahanaumokuakeensis TaxID=197479 RepID=A0A1E2VB14_9GAMM|nr:nucleotidyltransferase family protein [Terasakiispira papahanaumokuakeensis]ODC04164.1 alcohol dehydrogenase [Terasakiispira papahanaumokuakeensis]